MLSIKYQPLFTISLLHDYYAGSNFNDVLIVPDTDTKKLFQDQKIICRINDNILNAYVQTTDDKPAISIEVGTVFRFYIFIQNSSFFNFTLLPINQSGPYYFNNKNDNFKNNRLYLSTQAPAYKSTDTYTTGDIVKQSNRVFECIQPNLKTDKHNTTDTAFWRDIIAHKLLSASAYNDVQAYMPGVQVKFDSKLYESIKASNISDKHSPAEGDYWQEITDEAYVSDADVWATPDAGLRANLFAVIDIGFAIGEKDTYAFTDENNSLQSKNYFIRFKNRSTFWKFISQKNAVTAISDTNNIYSFSNALKKDEFISVVPVPLSFSPLNSIKMNATVNARSVEINGLQNPGVEFIKPGIDSNNFQLFSEVYLNY